MSDQTELDKLRAEYVAQALAVMRDEPDEEQQKFMIDMLFSEWGAKAYYQGREHMAERMKRCADEWKKASG